MWVIYNKHTGVELERLPLNDDDWEGVQAVIDGLNAAQDYDMFAARWED